MFSTGKTFFGRLTEVEKIRIRNAGTMERLEFILDAHHRFEFAGTAAAVRKAFMEAVDLVRDEFTMKSSEAEFGNTWKF